MGFLGSSAGKDLSLVLIFNQVLRPAFASMGLSQCLILARAPPDPHALMTGRGGDSMLWNVLEAHATWGGEAFWLKVKDAGGWWC